MTNILSFIYKPIFVRYKRWNRRTSLSKRQQLVLITLALTSGLVATQIVPPDYRYQMVAVLSVITYLLSAFGLREDLGGVEWITLIMLPVMFTAAISLFYFLLPVRWLTRIPIAALYAVGMYALLLTENIYNVAVNRTIALLRAAHTVGFLLTLVTFFLLIQTVLAWNSYAWINSVMTLIVAFLLSLQSLWSITLPDRIEKSMINLSVFVSLAMAELIWVLSFWPADATIQALFLTTCFYSFLGMAQQYLQEKLYKKTIIEFISVIAIVFMILLFTTHWRGNL